MVSEWSHEVGGFEECALDDFTHLVVVQGDQEIPHVVRLWNVKEKK